MLQLNGLRVIEDAVRHHSQGWTREATVEWQGHRIRATVYRDVYPQQSRIHVDVFSPATLSWNTVQRLSGTDHTHLASFSERDDAAISASAEATIAKMVAYAQEVLS